MKRNILTLGLCCLFSLAAHAQDIVINEIMASNVDAVLDPSINYGSWIELYNKGSQDFSLEGLYVTDDELNLKKFRLNERAGERVVPAKGFKVIYFDHHDLYAPWQVDFKLSYEGGTIMLTDGQQVLASQAYPQAVGRTSYARRINGGSTWSTTYTPTPGASNANSKFGTRQVDAPVFDVQTPFVDQGQQITLTTENSTLTTIRYTTDGSTPTLENGETYSGPITLYGNTAIRARAFRTGYLPSEVSTRTYLTDGTAYPFPIISVTTDDGNLHDYDRGLFMSSWWGGNGRPGNGRSDYCNWNMDWDRPVNFEYITTDGEYAINQEVDMSMCGGWSRAWTPHSFKLKAAKYYMGRNSLDYDFFPGSKPALKHRALQVRNGGNDTSHRIKDAALQELVRRSGLYIDCQAWQPVHVFLNGGYYAVLNMREPNNKRFAQSNYGLDDDLLDLFEIGPDSGYVQMVGTNDSFLQWYDLSADAAAPDTYAQITALVDIDEYINYMAVELYLNNTDWPQNNAKAFRSQQDGKFHFVLFDLDFAFANDGEGDSPIPFSTFAAKKTYTFNSLYGKQDWVYNEDTEDWEQTWITPWKTGERLKAEIQFVTIFLQMLQNEDFRRQFIDTYCLLGGSVFDPTRVKDIVGEMRDYMNTGMKLAGESCTSTASKITSTLTATRQTKMVNTLKSYDLMQLKKTKTTVLNLSSFIRDDENKQVAFDEGTILVNGLEVPTGKFRGKIFHPITIQAIAPAGYKFEGWTDLTGKNVKCADAIYELPSNLSTLSVRASWVKMTAEELAAAGLASAPVVVNEVSAANDIHVNDYLKKEDWIELYNTTDEDIDLAGLYLTDNVSKPQKYQIPTDDPRLNTIIPAHGYKQIWCDKQPNIGSAIHASFKLDKDGGTIMLSRYSDDGQLLFRDSLAYDAHTAQQTFGRYPDGGTRTYTMPRHTFLARNGFTPSAAIHLTGIPGDINNDALVTDADLKALLRAYLAATADNAASQPLLLYDLNQDGRFTMADITFWLQLRAAIRK